MLLISTVGEDIFELGGVLTGGAWLRQSARTQGVVVAGAVWRTSGGFRRRSSGHGAPTLWPSAGSEIAQPAHPPTDRFAPRPRLQPAASDPDQQHVDLASECPPLLVVQALQQRLDRPTPRLPNSLGGGGAGLGQTDGDRAPVATAALAQHIAVCDQPVDQPHRRRVREADDAAELLDGRVLEELAQRDQGRGG